jgi:hypothetical protein
VFGDFAFSVVEAREKDAPPLLDVIGNDCAFLQLKAECDVDQRGRHFEQLLRERGKFVDR